MKILVASIGTGRNRQDIASAVLFSMRRHQPDRVICCCSAKTVRETFPLIQEQAADEFTIDRPRVTGNEENVQALFAEYTQLLDELKKQSADAELIVDFTSGTKPMSAAMFAAAVSRRVYQVSYVTGPKDETGRVTISTDVEHLTPSLVTADEDLRQAAAFFNQYEFAAARDIADRYRRVLSDGPLKKRAKTMFFLADAYHAWELFNWQEAVRKLAKVLNPREGTTPPQRECLEKQRQFLADIQPKCKNHLDVNRWKPHRLADLYTNAARRIDQGRFDDALARCYRSLEYLAQWRLATEHGIEDTGRVSRDRIPEKMRDELNGGGDIKLGLARSYQLLSVWEDPLGKKYEQLFVGKGDWAKATGPLSGWLQRRNQSYLAHGFQPVDAQTARQLHRQLLELLKEFVPDIEPLLETAELIQWEQ